MRFVDSYHATCPQEVITHIISAVEAVLHQENFWSETCLRSSFRDFPFPATTFGLLLRQTCVDTAVVLRVLSFFLLKACCHTRTEWYSFFICKLLCIAYSNSKVFCCILSFSSTTHTITSKCENEKEVTSFCLLLDNKHTLPLATHERLTLTTWSLSLT